MRAIQLKTRWTVKGLRVARDHQFHQFRRTPVGLLMHFIATQFVLIGTVVLCSSFNIIALILTILGMYWLVFFGDDTCKSEGVDFRRLGNRTFEMKWIIDKKRIRISFNDLFKFNFFWKSIFKITQAPEGFLLYLTDTYIYYLPNQAFSSESDCQLFAELARAKVKNFGEAGFVERELLRLCSTEPEPATVAPPIQDLGMTDLEYAALVAQGRDPVEEQLYPDHHLGPAPDS